MNINDLMNTTGKLCLVLFALQAYIFVPHYELALLGYCMMLFSEMASGSGNRH